MLTPAVLGFLRIPASAAPLGASPSNALLGKTLEATLESVLPDGVLLRLADGKQLQAQGDLPFPLGSSLVLKGMPLPEGAGVRLQVVQATPPRSPALLAPLLLGEAAPLLAKLQSSQAQSPLGDLLRTLLHAGAAIAEQPETWATWMEASMRALSDPSTSPAEAAFHQLQAKEGTALFELPLPWAPGADPMRIWIERERDPQGGEADAVHRVFLSVPFSTLGDVRLGLEQRAAGLRVRVWLADPTQLADAKVQVQAELASLGRPVDLQVLPLPPGTPDLRALAGAQPLQAMG